MSFPSGVRDWCSKSFSKVIRGLHPVQLTRPHLLSHPCSHEMGQSSTISCPASTQAAVIEHQSEQIATISGRTAVVRCDGANQAVRVETVVPGLNSAPSLVGNLVQIQMRDTLSASDVRRTIRGIWSTRGASFFACFLCCVNFYTLSRFSMLAYLLKGSFIIQFVILSVIFGLPLLLFLTSLGQYLGAGFLDVWFISPAFKGIGAAFLFTYAAIAIYSSVPIAWLFVYFRDSFLATRETPYKWSYCSSRYSAENCIKTLNLTRHEYVGWSVSAYFRNQVMVQGTSGEVPDNARINTAFNLALIWAMAFIVLSRGMKSAGKIFVILSVVPLILFAMVSIRFTQQFGNGIEQLFASNGKAFLTDSLSWLLAARETFLVWTAFGAVALNVCSHNKGNHNLIRQLALLFVLVMATLILSSCFFASTMEVIRKRNISYSFSSYEDEPLSTFFKVKKNGGTSVKKDLRLISGANLFVGENLLGISDITSRSSHYSVMRFAVEVFPSALALEGAKSISSFWAMSFYLSAILLSLGSLFVVWASVVEAIISIYPQSLRLWKSIVTILSCIGAYFLGLPMVYGNGISILYYFDFAFGSLWWLSLLYLLLIIGVLIIRGRPCGAENLVTMLSSNESVRSWLLPSLTFHWNLIIPVIIMILSIAFTRSYSAGGLTWTQLVAFYPNWPLWAQYLAVVLQIAPLILVFLCGIVQAVFHLCVHPVGTTHERLQALFCPPVSVDEISSTAASTAQGIVNDSFIEEPPPKYTPPPSYSAATSRAAVKRIQQSLTSTSFDLHFLGSTDHGAAEANPRSRINHAGTLTRNDSHNKKSSHVP